MRTGRGRRNRHQRPELLAACAGGADWSGCERARGVPTRRGSHGRCGSRAPGVDGAQCRQLRRNGSRIVLSPVWWLRTMTRISLSWSARWTLTRFPPAATAVWTRPWTALRKSRHPGERFRLRRRLRPRPQRLHGPLLRRRRLRKETRRNLRILGFHNLARTPPRYAARPPPRTGVDPSRRTRPAETKRTPDGAPFRRCRHTAERLRAEHRDMLRRRARGAGRRAGWWCVGRAGR